MLSCTRCAILSPLYVRLTEASCLTVQAFQPISGTLRGAGSRRSRPSDAPDALILLTCPPPSLGGLARAQSAASARKTMRPLDARLILPSSSPAVPRRRVRAPLAGQLRELWPLPERSCSTRRSRTLRLPLQEHQSPALRSGDNNLFRS